MAQPKAFSLEEVQNFIRMAYESGVEHGNHQARLRGMGQEWSFPVEQLGAWQAAQNFADIHAAVNG